MSFFFYLPQDKFISDYSPVVCPLARTVGRVGEDIRARSGRVEQAEPGAGLERRAESAVPSAGRSADASPPPSVQPQRGRGPGHVLPRQGHRLWTRCGGGFLRLQCNVE